MRWTSTPHQPEPPGAPSPAEPPALHDRRWELRRFGRTMGLVAAALAGFVFWMGHATAASILLGISALFLVAAYGFPGGLDGVERAWMRFAHIVSIASTFVVLTAVFYLAVLPVGLLLRVLRKDVLGLKLDRARTSYWEPVEAGGSATRPDKPF